MMHHPSMILQSQSHRLHVLIIHVPSLAGKTMLIPERARVMGRLFRSDAIYRRHRGCEDLPEEGGSFYAIGAAVMAMIHMVP